MAELTETAHLPREVVARMRCPLCARTVSVAKHVQCRAGHTFPIVGRIPRLVVDAWEPNQTASVEQTKRAFAHQWNQFGDDATVTTADLALHLPVGWSVEETFNGVALDVGCGMGRYTRLTTDAGATAIGLDVSLAVEKAAALWPDIPFVQADIAAAPFADHSFDLVYSFGVLHHLPQPERGLNACWRLVRPGGKLLIWVYSERRDILRRARRLARHATARAPTTLPLTAHVAAVALWTIQRLPGPGKRRLAYYGEKTFRQIYIDSHDALAAPLESYITERDCCAWLEALAPARGGYEPRRDGSGWIIWAQRPHAM